MNISEYIEAARKFDNHCEDSMLDALVYGAIGEALELWEEVNVEWPDRGRILAEAGDVAWNLARLFDYLSHVETHGRLPEVQGTYVDSMRDAMIAVLFQARRMAGFMEKAKREDGPDVRFDIGTCALHMWYATEDLVEHLGVSFEDVAKSNIDKLTKRYAERGLQLREA